MSRDARLYLADVVAAGEAILRYTDDVTFQVFAANDEKRAAVERQLFIIGEAAARLPDDWKQRLPAVPWRKIESGMRACTPAARQALQKCLEDRTLGRDAGRSSAGG